MKLEELSPIATIKNHNKSASTAFPSHGPAQAIDPERNALIAAIKSATLYAAIVVKLEGAKEPVEALMTFAEFIRVLHLPNSFAGYAIIGPDVAGSAPPNSGSNAFIARILFKAVGSQTAASIKQSAAQFHSPTVEFCDDYVDVQTNFVAHIDDICEEAVCIAAAGRDGMIPLWVPLTYVPSH